MPNRILFNDTADNLQVQIYGSQQGKAIQTDTSGNIIVGSITTTVPVTGTVHIDSITTTVPVTGTVHVDSITTTVPVTGTVAIDSTTPVSVTGTVHVDSITTTVPVTGTVAIDSTTPVSVTGTVAVFGTPTINLAARGILATSLTVSANSTCLQLNVEQYSDFTYYIKNNSQTNNATVKVQIAPTSNMAANFWVDSPTSAITVATASAGVIITQNYLNYAQLSVTGINPSTDTLDIYFLGQI